MRNLLFKSTKAELKVVLDKYKAKEPTSLTSQFPNRRSKVDAIKHQEERKQTVTELFPCGKYYLSFCPLISHSPYQLHCKLLHVERF